MSVSKRRRLQKRNLFLSNAIHLSDKLIVKPTEIAEDVTFDCKDKIANGETERINWAEIEEGVNITLSLLPVTSLCSRPTRRERVHSLILKEKMLPIEVPDEFIRLVMIAITSRESELSGNQINNQRKPIILLRLESKLKVWSSVGRSNIEEGCLLTLTIKAK